MVIIKKNHKNTYLYNLKNYYYLFHTLFQKTKIFGYLVVLEVLSHSVEDVFYKVKEYLKIQTIVINTSKGFSKNGEALLSFIKLYHKNCFALLGPTFANNLIKNEYSAFTVASDNKFHFEISKELFKKSNILLDFSFDYKLIEIASIFKNIFAIASSNLYEEF